MKTWSILLLAVALSLSACKEEEQPLLQNSNPNNSDNNQNNTNNTNSNTTPANSENSDVGTIIPADPNADYTGEIPAFSGNGAAAEFVHNMHVKQCEQVFGCSSRAGALFAIAGLRVGTVGDCVAALNAQRPPSVAQGAVDGGRTTFDSAATAGCLEAMDDVSCAQTVVGLREPFATFDGCELVFTGDRGDMLTCDQTWDCDPNEYCQTTFDGCFGGCQSNDLFRPTCGAEGTICEWDEVCTLEGTCGDKLTEGAACKFDSECSGGLACENGTCTELTVVDLDSNCGAGYVCRPGLVCNGDGVCEPIKDVGDSCRFSGECVWNAGCIRGTCESTANGGQCEQSADCASRRCADLTCVGATQSCYDR